jgi:gamma-butyrobetaine dioxygenase
MTTPDPIAVIADLFATEGEHEYLGEPVTQASHMLQAAALARSACAPPPLVAAALRHDLMRGTDNRHSDAGADWLAQWFGEEVTGPVRLHVAAKRYLCAVEPGYLAALSSASVYTLGVQGGPMDAAERAEFEADRQSGAALRLRRWDDAAKDPAAAPPAFGYYKSLLRRLLRTP